MFKDGILRKPMLRSADVEIWKTTPWRIFNRQGVGETRIEAESMGKDKVGGHN